MVRQDARANWVLILSGLSRLYRAFLKKKERERLEGLRGFVKIISNSKSVL